eukprot:11667547-Alexandrium_andersonii.AAC.1
MVKQDKLNHIHSLQCDAQDAAKRHDTRALYKIVRALTPRPPSSPAAIVAKDGTPTANAREAAE